MNKWLYPVLFVVGVCIGALLAGGGGVTFFEKTVIVDVKIDVQLNEKEERDGDSRFWLGATKVETG